MRVARVGGGVVLALMIGLCGCSSARYVTLEPNGGVVAIPSNTDSFPHYHRSKAEELMARRCPQGYVVEQEGEVAVGTHTTTHSEANFSSAKALLFGGATQSSETRNLHEWQITFRGK